MSNETVCHASLDCHHTSIMWNTHLLSNTVITAPRSSFGEFLVWIIEKCDHEALGHWCFFVGMLVREK